jgi:uncharacterized membrane protein YhiD involved in acid resistance
MYYELAQSLVSWLGLAAIIIILIVIVLLPKLKNGNDNDKNKKKPDADADEKYNQIIKLFEKNLTKLDIIIKLLENKEKVNFISQQIINVQLEIKTQHQTIQRLLDSNIASQINPTSRLNSFDQQKSTRKLDKIKTILGDTLNG